MPEIGRWNGIDQLAESYLSASPYAYVLNNPISLFDPDGRVTMAALTQAMWDQTPDGTNSYWQNNNLGDSDSGGKPGGGGGSFVYVGGTAGLYAGYGIGSTLDMNGNFNSFYGTVTNGVLNYMYWTNGVPASGNSIEGLNAHKGSLNLNASNSSKNIEWYGPSGRINWFFSTAGVLSGFAGVVQSQHMYSQGIRRGISGNYQLTGRNLSQFGKMAMTDATRPSSRIGRFGKFAGHASFYLGVAFDTMGIINGDISVGKGLLNTGFGVAGNWGGSIGASLSTVYFGVDNFYPGGWPQLFDDGNMVQGKLDEGFNQAGPYRINVFGAHEPK